MWQDMFTTEKKANKAGAWLREIARLNGFVDVASISEFVHVLANGIRGEHVGVTGAAKNNDLLWLAARHGATVAIDALDELERAIAIARQAEKISVLLRILPPQSQNSRFGFSESDLEVALQRCVASQEHIEMLGFSFHLDGYAVAPRAELALYLIEKCLEARSRGMPCSTISIGGGFACSYISQEDWQYFEKNYSP